MPHTRSTIATPAHTPPSMHPMDPRRGENISPRFAAVLCWLLRLPPMTRPAIVGVSVSGHIVFAATDRDPYRYTPIGDWHDLSRNLRDWGDPAAPSLRLPRT